MAQQTIEFNQGDDYLLRLNNFNPEHKYKVYIQFFDEDGAFVGNQLSYDVNYTDSVDVLLPAAFTDNLTVPLGEDYQLYYLGGKQAEVVENKINLYAFDNDDTTLYTHSLNIAVDDVLYDSDNEATEYEVGSINSIVNDSGTFERDSANNINEYKTSLYAWRDGVGNYVYTKTDDLEGGDTVYNSQGEATGYTVGQYHNLYAWRSNLSGTVYYTTSATPSRGDIVRNILGSQDGTKDVSSYNSETDEITCNGFLIPDDGILKRDVTEDTIFILVSDTNYTRWISSDVKTIVRVIAYCWSLSGEHIYTLAENPAVGDMTYTYDVDLIEGDEITAINSFLVSTDEYVRNANNDIEIIISTAYTGEKTIISELANKRPVIVYKKRAEGPV